MKTVPFLLFATALLASAPALAGETLNLAPFTGVKASDGADVVIRHGDRQQIVLAAGSTQFSRLEVRDGVLEIETCKDWSCPHHYRLEVDITMPDVATVEAEDGARIQAQGDFPTQARLAAKATDGGDLDVRAIAAADVHATATDGGELSIQPRRSMDARAEDGGVVRYWGHPSISNLTVDDGGAVRQES